MKNKTDSADDRDFPYSSQDLLDFTAAVHHAIIKYPQQKAAIYDDYQQESDEKGRFPLISSDFRRQNFRALKSVIPRRIITILTGYGHKAAA